mgnify:CR=1 FL=1|tara:strand:- start:99446 stop:99796 length:351 start_codon:yes stop_codon:yes gene_type:complete
MKFIAILFLAISIIGCSSGQRKEIETAEVVFQSMCPNCWVVASHINQINPEDNIFEIAKSSEAYSFRLALMHICNDCYSVLAKKEKAENRILSSNEAKQYIESEEYAASMALLKKI